jgi:subtilisin-like proprotein convertase family protein
MQELRFLPVTAALAVMLWPFAVAGTPPANDDCEEAQVLGTLPATVVGSTLGAEAWDPWAGEQCGTSIDNGGVWYVVLGTGTNLRATTCPAEGGAADYDTKISVYCNGCGACGAPICVAGNDDALGVCDVYSSVTWCADAGMEQRIFVHGYQQESGNFTLRVEDTGQPCVNQVPCFPPPPLGACCLADAPYCLEDVGQGECEDLEGSFQACLGCLSPTGRTAVHQDVGTTPIPDDDSLGVTLIQQGPAGESVADVDVGMEIAHTANWDLTITLRHAESGVQQVLWDERCSSTDGIRATADDETGTPTCQQVVAGPMDDVRWRPSVAGSGPLAVFDGLDAGGPWELEVVDAWPGDQGAVERWQLALTMLRPTCPDPGHCSDVWELVAEKDSGVTTLRWREGNAGARYDVVGGRVADLLAEESTSAATCLANDLSDPDWIDLAHDPAPGQGRYYLVRAQDAFCHGTWGHASDGSERVAHPGCP